MNKNEDSSLKRKLEVLADSVLDSSYKVEFERLYDKLGTSRDDLVGSVVGYTMGGENFENSEYADKSMRLTLHLHNLVKGSYHLDKGVTVLEYVLKNNPKTLVDIGYGVPSEYIFDRVSKDLSTTLLDQDKSAEDVSRAIFEARGLDAKKVRYDVHDMDKDDYVGDFDTYVMLDSVEHTVNPDKYLEGLVKNSGKDAKFIFSIPIMKNYEEDGSKVTHFHYAEWLTTDDAVEWLSEKGLEVTDSKLIIPNPDVDYFAYRDYLEASYKCFMVNCQKKKESETENE